MRFYLHKNTLKEENSFDYGMISKYKLSYKALPEGAV